MMAVAAMRTQSVAEVAEAAARRLVMAQHWEDSSFINLPLIFPGGGHVTVKIDRVQGGFRVSDNGFAFRELESIGAGRSFPRTAKSIVEPLEIEVNRRMIYVDVTEAQVVRAICDVAMSSWQVADRIYSRVSEEEESEIEDYLRERLAQVFGREKLKEEGSKVTGHSTSEWDVSAVIQLPDHLAVFHAVSSHANSVFKTSTAFHDIALLDNAPKLVAVIRSKRELGPRLDLLAQAGRVIEERQADDVYQRAAA